MRIKINPPSGPWTCDLLKITDLELMIIQDALELMIQDVNKQRDIRYGAIQDTRIRLFQFIRDARLEMKGEDH